MLGVALVGCGAIGTVIAKAIDRGEAGSARLVVVYDRVPERARRLAESLRTRPLVAESFDEVIGRSDVSVVVEAASQEAVREYAERVLRAGKDLVVMSVGALLDGGLLERLLSVAEEMGVRIYVPSGAAVGLDGVKAAALGGLVSVTLTTTKPPRSLKGAPYIEQRGIDLERIDRPTVIYEGPAEEAVRLFPANINVVAALSLAGLGPERTRVRIVVDPGADRIVHEVRAVGSFGELVAVARNIPHPDNPRTSYLAALSAVGLLKRLSERLVVGT